MPQEPPLVFIVDDDVAVRESLLGLVAEQGWQAEAFSSAGEFLAHARPRLPSCLVLDVSLPDQDGLDLQQRVAAEHGVLPIIFITGCGDVEITVRAMKAGAVEFLTKPFGDAVLVAAIEHALAGSRAALQREAELRTLRDCYESLSRRERQVMSLVISGRLNKQVGDELGISVITVKAHRGQVMRKMNANSLPELVTQAASLGVAPAPSAHVGPARRQPPPLALTSAPVCSKGSSARGRG